MPESPLELEIERVRLRAVRSIARAKDGGESTTDLDDRIASLDRTLDGIDSARGLAELLELRPDELGFLWAVIAATVDPEFALHLPHTGPRYGRTGISLAQYATIAELGRRGVQLGAELLGSNPLVRHHLIEPIDPRTVAVETAWVAVPRVIAFLAGDEAVDPVVAQAGGLVAMPDDPVIDEGLAMLRGRIGQLASGPPCAIVIQGRRGSGRRTLARAAVDRPVVVIDLDRLQHAGSLAGALAALAREILSRCSPASRS